MIKRIDAINYRCFERIGVTAASRVSGKLLLILPTSVEGINEMRPQADRRR